MSTFVINIPANFAAELSVDVCIVVVVGVGGKLFDDKETPAKCGSELKLELDLRAACNEKHISLSRQPFIDFRVAAAVHFVHGAHCARMKQPVVAKPVDEIDGPAAICKRSQFFRRHNSTTDETIEQVAGVEF